jgi:hypothetical protein
MFRHNNHTSPAPHNASRSIPAKLPGISHIPDVCAGGAGTLGAVTGAGRGGWR